MIIVVAFFWSKSRVLHPGFHPSWKRWNLQGAVRLHSKRLASARFRWTPKVTLKDRFADRFLSGTVSLISQCVDKSGVIRLGTMISSLDLTLHSSNAISVKPCRLGYWNTVCWILLDCPRVLLYLPISLIEILPCPQLPEFSKSQETECSYLRQATVTFLATCLSSPWPAAGLPRCSSRSPSSSGISPPLPSCWASLTRPPPVTPVTFSHPSHCLLSTFWNALLSDLSPYHLPPCFVPPKRHGTEIVFCNSGPNCYVCSTPLNTLCGTYSGWATLSLGLGLLYQGPPTGLQGCSWCGGQIHSD